MDEENKVSISSSDDMLDEYNELNSVALLQEKYFICDIPYNSIIEKMNEQFIDYINLKDTMDYVAKFFNSLYISYANIDDDEEEFPDDCREALDALQSDFIEKICKMFETRIGIEFPDIETMEPDKTVTVLHDIYTYFIINARRNFKTAISEYINTKLETVDENYFVQLQQIIENDFLTIITVIKPTSFLQVTGGQPIYEYFMSNTFVGNFMKKYTASLFKNYEFKIEIINYTTMVRMLSGNTENA